MTNRRDGNIGTIYARLDAAEAVIKLARKAMSVNDAYLVYIYLEEIKMHVEKALKAGEALP